MVWVAVDEPHVIQAVAEEVDRLLPEGLVTLERAQVGEHPGDLEPGGDAAAKLTVYPGRGERTRGRPAHLAVVDLLRKLGVEGASVLMGVDGVRWGERRRARFIGANGDVPMMIIAISSRETLLPALPALGDLLGRSVVTLERVRILKRDGRPLAQPEVPPPEDEGGLGLWHKVTVHTGEDAHAPGDEDVLYSALLRELRRAGASGASVLRGVWGYSGDGEPHGDRMLSVRRRVPVVAVCIDRPGRMAGLWPIVDVMTARHGLVTGEIVPAFRAAGHGARVGGLRLADLD
jgi:PII-like signaling protein